MFMYLCKYQDMVDTCTRVYYTDTVYTHLHVDKRMKSCTGTFADAHEELLMSCVRTCWHVRFIHTYTYQAYITFTNNRKLNAFFSPC